MIKGSADRLAFAFMLFIVFAGSLYLYDTYKFDVKCWWNDWDCKTMVYTSELSFDGIHEVNIGTTKCKINEELPKWSGGFYAQGSSLGYEAEQTLTRLKNEGWKCN